MDEQTKAIAIVRVASTEQRNGNQSTQSQLDKIQEYAAKNGLEIVETFHSVGNASSKNHTLKKALGYCKGKPEVRRVVVTSPDRLARSIDEFYWWRLVFERANVKIHFTDKGNLADPLGRFWEAVSLAMTRSDNEMRSLRAKRAWQRRKSAKS